MRVGVPHPVRFSIAEAKKLQAAPCQKRAQHPSTALGTSAEPLQSGGEPPHSNKQEAGAPRSREPLGPACFVLEEGGGTADCKGGWRMLDVGLRIAGGAAERV